MVRRPPSDLLNSPCWHQLCTHLYAILHPQSVPLTPCAALSAGISFGGSVGAPVAYVDFVDKAAQEAALGEEHLVQGRKLTVLEKIPRDLRPRRAPMSDSYRRRDDRGERR